MRVLHVTRAPLGGLATVLRELLPALQRRGIDVDLVWDCPRAPYGESTDWTEDVGGSERLQLSGLRLGPIQRLRDLADRADVVHLHGAWAGALGRLVLRPATPIVYSPHGGAFHRFRGSVVGGFSRVAEGLLAKRADAIVVASAFERGLVERQLGARRDRRLHLIRHGRAINCPAGSGMARDSQVVAIVGRLVPEKRVDRAIEAFGRANGARPLQLRVVGDGECRSALESHVASAGLDGVVRFEGYRALEPVFYSDVDVLLSASSGESFGLNISEALMAGCSVVSTAVGISPEVLEAPFGFVVSDDVASIAAGLSTALDLRAASPDVPVAAMARGQSAFKLWDEVAGTYASLYETIGQSTPNRPFGGDA